MFGARRRAVPLSDTGGMVYDEVLGLRRNVIYQKAWEVWVKAPLLLFLGGGLAIVIRAVPGDRLGNDDARNGFACVN